MSHQQAHGLELRSGRRIDDRFPLQPTMARAEFISMRSGNGANKIADKSTQIDPLLTIDEVCALLKLEPQTIYQLTYRGKIPHFKIANRLRFRRSEIVEWIERHKVAKRPREDFRQGM
jgi:excisionase family DNA binding protein